jgi:hypothetical protein
MEDLNILHKVDTKIMITIWIKVEKIVENQNNLGLY